MKESTHTWYFLVKDLLDINLEKRTFNVLISRVKEDITNSPFLLKLTNAFLYFFLWKQTGTAILSYIGTQALQLSCKDGLKMKIEDGSLVSEYTRFYMIEET